MDGVGGGSKLIPDGLCIHITVYQTVSEIWQPHISFCMGGGKKGRWGGGDGRGRGVVV
jgi:hypothetical protein